MIPVISVFGDVSAIMLFMLSFHSCYSLIINPLIILSCRILFPIPFFLFLFAVQVRLILDKVARDSKGTVLAHGRVSLQAETGASIDAVFVVFRKWNE